jgi:hypothetical protein
LPSWQNKLIETDIRQKAWRRAGLLLFQPATRGAASVVSLGAILPHWKLDGCSQETGQLRGQVQ